MSTANLYKSAARRRFFSALKLKSAVLTAAPSPEGPVPQRAGPLPLPPGSTKGGGTCVPPPLSHWARALPMARQASSAVSSGASQQMTLGTARPMLDSSQSFSQVRIQSPLPQP